VRDAETGKGVTAEWFDEHVDELSEAAIHAMKDQVHRDRNPVGA